MNTENHNFVNEKVSAQMCIAGLHEKKTNF